MAFSPLVLHSSDLRTCVLRVSASLVHLYLGLDWPRRPPNCMERGAEWIPHGLAFWAYPQYCICIVEQMKWGVGEIRIQHLIVSRTACHKSTSACACPHRHRECRCPCYKLTVNMPLTHPKLLPALLPMPTHISSHGVQTRLYMLRPPHLTKLHPIKPPTQPETLTRISRFATRRLSSLSRAKLNMQALYPACVQFLFCYS